jgi:hypothetical protein
MTRGTVVSILLVLLLAAAAVADEATTNMQGIILESFDDPGSRWVVRGGKFLAVQGEDTNFDYPFDYQIVPDVWPEAMGEPVVQNGGTPSVIGAQASFTRRGYNYLEFVPVEAEDGPDGEPVPRGIPIPGRPMAIDLWAWGSNYNYYLEIQVRDYRGVVHTLKVGDMGYIGWKNLQTVIPGSIPRSVRYVPFKRQMELVKVVLWTRPDEAVNGFQIYLDQIKVLTDMFETPYDGDALSDPQFVLETWGSEQRR